MLEHVKTVLSHTTHPGNIGATARALKVMGLSRLALVNPHHFPSEEATQRASHADDLLERAEVFDNLHAAIEDCRLIVGTSARTRTLPSKLITPRELAEAVSRAPQQWPVAVLYGTENSGLTNDELHLCHYHVCIPTNPEYSSLNIASAVQLLAYEFRLADQSRPQLPEQRILESEMLASHEQLEGMLKHLEAVMVKVGYRKPEQAKFLDQRLNRLFKKAQVTQSELNILRGFLSAVERN